MDASSRLDPPNKPQAPFLKEGSLRRLVQLIYSDVVKKASDKRRCHHVPHVPGSLPNGPKGGSIKSESTCTPNTGLYTCGHLMHEPYEPGSISTILRTNQATREPVASSVQPRQRRYSSTFGANSRNCFQSNAQLLSVCQVLTFWTMMFFSLVPGGEYMWE